MRTGLALLVVVLVGMTGPGCGEDGEPSRCGNGVIDDLEQCDGAEFGDQTCQTYHYAGGSLQCLESCFIDLRGCIPGGYCGDLVIDQGENCDGTNFGGHTCESYFYPLGGYLACDPWLCNVDFSGCIK